MLRLFEASLSIYNRLIAERFNIDPASLEKLMDEVPKLLPISVTIKPVAQLLPQAVATEGKGTETCPYLYTKGVKANTLCGSKLKKGNDFCSKHKKKEEKEEKRKEQPEETEKEKEKEKQPPAAPVKKNLVLRMNKVINKWWHSESGLVFKSSEDKVVIGVFKDDQVVDLSDKDIEKCIAYKFRYEVTKRKRSEDDEKEEEEAETKKQKTEDTKKKIDEDFINLNKSAKNVEELIKELFTTDKKSDTEESEEEDDVNEEVWEGGAEETKENYEEEEVVAPPISDDEGVDVDEEILEEEVDDDEE